MGEVIAFPQQRRRCALSPDEITEISKDVIWQMYRQCTQHDFAVSDKLKFVRDFVVLRKLLEAAMLRHIGVENEFTRLLDAIFDNSPTE